MAFNYKTEMSRYRKYYQTLEHVVGRPKSHLYTTAIFSFLVVSLFGWYAIRPTIQTILFLRREIADDQIVNQKMEDKITTMIQAQSNYQAIADKLPLLTDALPDDPDAIRVVAALKNLSQSLAASISALSVAQVPLTSQTPSATASAVSEPASKKEKIAAIPISLTVSGPFSSLATFLDGVLSMRRILTIENFTIKPDTISATASESASTTLRLVLKLNMHYLTK